MDVSDSSTFLEKDRQRELGSFYTPMPLVKKMIEKIEPDENSNRFWIEKEQRFKTVLDPTAGSGNIIIQILDDKVTEHNDPLQALSTTFGIEIDETTIAILKERINDWAIQHKIPNAEKIIDINFHLGDALKDYCYEFNETYKYPLTEEEEYRLLFKQSFGKITN